jgi:two-component system, OmpR family, sensor kinase
LSFRKRLTAALVGFGAVFLLCPTLVFYLQVESTLFDNHDDALRSVARAELASAFDEPSEEPHVHDSPPLSLPSGLQEVSWIINSQGQVVAKSGNISQSEIDRVMKSVTSRGSHDGEVLLTCDVNNASYRLLVTHLQHLDQRYTEVLGLSREPLLARLSSLRGEMTIIFLISLVLLFFTAFYLSRRLTAPLSLLTQQLKEMTFGSKPQLLSETEPLDPELRILYESTNGLLKRVDRLLESQKLFVSDASHEIRAPLTNLRVALEVCLRKEREAPEYREVLEVCKEEVVRLGKLAERLLTLSRLDSDQLHLDIRPVNLDELISEATALIQTRLSQLGLTLESNLQQPHPIHCDPSAIRQVVDNLLDNALRYAPRGSSIKVELLDETDWVKFTITNAGHQLSEEQASKVFERFYRGDASRQRSTGGAGLGLSIASGFVEAHGGTFGLVIDEPDPDTVRFWFRLPKRVKSLD